VIFGCMPAIPDSLKRLSSRLGERFHRLPLDYPVGVITTAVVVALLGAWVYGTRLDIVSSRGALTDSEAEFNRLKQVYDRDFGRANDPVLLVVRAGPTADAPLSEPTVDEREAMRRVVRRWADGLGDRPDLFGRITVRIDPGELEPWTLLYGEISTVESAVGAGRSVLPTLASVAAAADLPDALLALDRELPGLAEGGGSGGARYLEALEGAFAHFRRVLEIGDTVPRPSHDGSALYGDAGYLTAADGWILLGVAEVLGDPSDRNRYEEPLQVARATLDDALETVPDSTVVSAGLAGEPALELEEQRVTRRDFMRSALIATVVISILFMWGFGSVVRPALAMACLGISVAATFLVAWLVVGHLNVLALVFTVILVALGIDFAIHLYVHYRQGRGEGLDPPGAVRRAHREIGDALRVDGMATAAAFLMAWFTDFPGLAELGVIAGMGLLICLLCMYLVFPAMLVLVDGRWGGPTKVPSVLGLMPKRMAGSGPGPFVFILVLLCTGAGFVFGERDFDTDILELQPENGETSRWQRLLLDWDDRSQFVIATYADEDALRSARNRLEALPAVHRTESVLPAHESRKRELLSEVCGRAGAVQVDLGGRAAPMAVRRRLFGLRTTLRRYAAAGPRAEDALDDVRREVDRVYVLLGGLSPELSAAALQRVQSDLRTVLTEVSGRLEAVFCPPPLELQTAPALFTDRFVGRSGRLALRVYPSVNTWSEGERIEFLEAVRGVEPDIFGGVVGFHENTRAMVRSFVQASVYSFLMITVMILLWTRSVGRTLLVLLPLVVSIGFLLGAMRWLPLGLDWNLANFFAGPILIGVGVAGGVHVVKAWRLGAEAFRGALAAVTLSSLTTMIGFGLLATGSHRGVASLGAILLLGIGFNLLACLFLLPAALRLLDPRIEDMGL